MTIYTVGQKDYKHKCIVFVLMHLLVLFSNKKTEILFEQIKKMWFMQNQKW